MATVAPPSEDDLRRLFERSPIGMYRSDSAGQFRFVNFALVAMLGYASADELMACNLGADIYADPDDRARLIEHYRTRGIVDGVKVAWRTRDGRGLAVRIYGHVVQDELGTSFDATVIDVTELDRVERRLAVQRAELEHTATTLGLVLRQMPAVYWVIDRELRVTGSGGAIEAMFGIRRGGFVGQTLIEIHANDPDGEERIAAHRRALAGEIVAYENFWGGRHLAVTIGPSRDARGEVIGAIGTSIDITSVRQLERRMIDAQRAESLGVLAAGLAHDFNNLLVAILGNADLALREVPPRAPGRVALDNIRNAGLRAAELTTQLLTFSGRGGTTSERVTLAPIVDELLAMLAPSLPTHLILSRALPGDLPALRGDATQVGQVVLNLLANARDAIGAAPGEIAISARVVTIDVADDREQPDLVLAPPPGRYVLVEVADTGPGIDAETRRRIFEPFFTTKPTGHGLGLASVLGIVRAHGGGLRLVSAPGAGARFEVLWPLHAPLARAADASPFAVGSSPEVALRRVLVIDDEELVRDVVARMVEDLGYAAVTASDGPEGLRLLASDAHIDAVVVDLTMPHMNGADVIAAVRQHRPDLPIVVCSGYDRDQRGGPSGDAYLAKPFRLDALEQTLARLVPR
jgi:PAS domain S-box-containing protein